MRAALLIAVVLLIAGGLALDRFVQQLRVEKTAYACQDGNGAACMASATTLLNGARWISVDEVRANALLKKGCELGLSDACLKHGELLIEEGPDAIDEAAQAFVKGCEGGETEACIHLCGLLFALPDSGLEQQADVCKKACAMGDEESCTLVARISEMQAHEEPSPEDAPSDDEVEVEGDPDEVAPDDGAEAPEPDGDTEAAPEDPPDDHGEPVVE
jgi:hypothetical protein